MISIRQAKSEDKTRWDNYVYQHPQSTPYHLFAWGESVHNAYNYHSIYFIAEQKVNIVGILPIVIMSVPLRGKTICSLPYCDQAGILADNDNIAELLLSHVISFANKSRIMKLELRQAAGSGNFDDTDHTGGKVRMLLPLSRNSNELLSSFKSKLRSQITKSKKNGLTVSLQHAFKEMSLINDFYSVFAYNMRSLGSPVHSKAWFYEIANNYKDDAVIAVVSLKNKPIGAGIVLKTHTIASIPWASTHKNYNSLSPNMLLYWSLLEYCCDHGIKKFDFGRSTYGEGTYNFKKQWGAQAVPLNWQLYQNGRYHTIQEKVNSGSEQLRTIFETIWKKTPLWATNSIGPKIRKFISL